MTTRNVTLSLPDELVRRVKVVAAERDTSMSALVRAHFESLVGSDRTYDEVWGDEEAFMATGSLRIGDQLTSREELHRR